MTNVKSKNRRLLSLQRIAASAIVWIFAGAAYGQHIPVNGTVTDATGELIIGASISEKGNERNGTVTDADGKFSLQTRPNAVLIVSYVGYARQEVRVGNGKNLAIVLTDDMQELEEVVVVGYGMQKKASLTGSVTTLNVDEIRSVPTGNLSNALAGRLAGVTVTSGNGGRPGNSSDIVIRSRGTWNSVSPLYVIDGVVRDKQAFDMLDANDVENFSILKDAAAASVYGARASNGVVLVTTRKGKEGKPVISYSGSVGAGEFAFEPERETVAQRIRLADVGQFEYRNVLSGGRSIDENGYHPAYSSIYKNGTDASEGYISSTGAGRVFSDEARAYYMDPSHQYDRLKEVYRTPVVQTHSLSISGGSESTKYYVGANYYNETGIFRSTDYDKYTVRSNVDFKINRHLSASLSMNIGSSRQSAPTTIRNTDESDTRLENVYRFLRRSTPLAPGIVQGKYVSDVIGDNAAGDSYSAFANGDAGLTRNQSRNAEYSAGVQWTIPRIKGLSVRGLYNRYVRHQLIKAQAIPYHTYLLVDDPAVTGDPLGMISLPQVNEASVQLRGMNYLEQRDDMNQTYQLNGIIHYSNTFGRHEVSGMLVYEQTEGYGEYSTSRREDFELFSRPYLNFGSNDRGRWLAGGGGSETGRISYVGRFTYAYAGKYLTDFSFRQDLSSNFDPAHRRGFFPSGSLAWRLSEEKFLKDRFSFLNNLKLRGSIGLTGNDNVVDVNGNLDPFQWLDRANVNAGGFYSAGDSSGKGVELSSVANTQITWEKTLNYNIGLDVRLFNMFTLDANYFFRKTYDILGSQTANIPNTFGANLSVSNYGRVNSFGCEMELGFDRRINRKLNFWAKGTFGWSDNELIEFAEPEGTKPWLSKLGKNWDRMSGPLTDGIVHQMFKIGEQNERGEDLYRVVTSTGNTYIIPYNYYRNATDRYVNNGHYNSLRPGWIFYRDLRGQDADGNPTAPDGYAEDNSDFDRDWTIDHLYPPYNYSLLLGGKWNGLSLDIFLQGTAGNQKGAMVHNGAITYWNGTTWGYWADDSYSVVDNPTGRYPMLNNYGGGGTGTNHFWVRNASFIRLKSMTLAYDLPINLLRKAGIASSRIYMTGHNLALLWSNMKFHDPELGDGSFNNPTSSDNANNGIVTYPLMRTLTVGLNLSF